MSGADLTPRDTAYCDQLDAEVSDLLRLVRAHQPDCPRPTSCVGSEVYEHIEGHCPGRVGNLLIIALARLAAATPATPEGNPQ